MHKVEASQLMLEWCSIRCSSCSVQAMCNTTNKTWPCRPCLLPWTLKYRWSCYFALCCNIWTSTNHFGMGWEWFGNISSVFPYWFSICPPPPSSVHSVYSSCFWFITKRRLVGQSIETQYVCMHVCNPFVFLNSKNKFRVVPIFTQTHIIII